MAHFDVTIFYSEVFYGIEADSKNEAIDKAQEMSKSGPYANLCPDTIDVECSDDDDDDEKE